ncbi:MAG: hypothetical protein ACI9GC_001105, partial [Phycisphaerales bacterium]
RCDLRSVNTFAMVANWKLQYHQMQLCQALLQQPVFVLAEHARVLQLAVQGARRMLALRKMGLVHNYAFS